MRKRARQKSLLFCNFPTIFLPTHLDLHLPWFPEFSLAWWLAMNWKRTALSSNGLLTFFTFFPFHFISLCWTPYSTQVARTCVNLFVWFWHCDFFCQQVAQTLLNLDSCKKIKIFVHQQVIIIRSISTHIFYLTSLKAKKRFIDTMKILTMVNHVISA